MNRETHWSRIAEDFEKRVTYVAGKRNIEAIKKQLTNLNPTGNVLELGCGNGTYSQIIASGAKSLYVTDLSDQMITLCQQRFADISNIKVEKQDCCSLNYPDGSFDCVVMINLLHVIASRQQAINESYRVLKSGGRLVIISFTTESMSFISKLCLMYRYLKAFGKPPAKAVSLTLDMTRNILNQAKLTVETARLIGRGSKAVFVTAKR